MLSKDDVMAALAAIPGPDGKTPLPESGAIDGVTIRDGKVFLAIKVDPARAPGDGSDARRRSRRRIKAMPGVASALVTLTAQAPRGAPRPAAAAGSRAPRRPRQPADRGRRRRSSRSPRARAGSASRRPPAISRSGSRRLGLRVGVLDADLFGPSMPRLFGITEKPALAADGKG